MQAVTQGSGASGSANITSSSVCLPQTPPDYTSPFASAFAAEPAVPAELPLQHMAGMASMDLNDWLEMNIDQL